jgi:hypothetical protein
LLLEEKSMASVCFLGPDLGKEVLYASGQYESMGAYLVE